MKTKINILHIVGGHSSGGAFRGAYILHNNLKKLNINSFIINDNLANKREIRESNFFYINDSIYSKFINYLFIKLEKAIKYIFLPLKRSTFTIGLLGFDITKKKIYEKADIVHFHWFGDGFINISSLKKINKPIVWTMRDMWCFTGGPHYLVDFDNLKKNFLNNYLLKYKKKIFKKKIQFIAISYWLKKKAISSPILKHANIKTIYNNIEHDQFKSYSKSYARSQLDILTNKKIILYGADNPQNPRKGWNILLKTIKKLDKEKYYLIIFGKFWSNKTIENLGIQFRNFGYVKCKKKLSYIYSSADIFLAISSEEAFGKTWAEAMLCNTPVICFKNSSTSEVLKHKINGYVCSKKNSNSLKVAIEWMTNSNGNNISKQNLRKICKIFRPYLIAKQYLEVYKYLLKSKETNIEK